MEWFDYKNPKYLITLGILFIGAAVYNAWSFWGDMDIGISVVIFIFLLVGVAFILASDAAPGTEKPIQKDSSKQRGGSFHKAFLTVQYTQLIEYGCTTYEKEVYNRGLHALNNDYSPIKVENWVESTLKQWTKLM
jgi:hypothetical protein